MTTSTTLPDRRTTQQRKGKQRDLRPGQRRERRGRTAFAYGTLLPTLIVVGVLMAYPMYVAIDLSLRDGVISNLLDLSLFPLTAGNYIDVLTSSTLAGDVIRSFIYTLGVLVPAFGIGLGLALLLNQAFPGRRIIRPLVLLPWAVPGVAVAAAFSWMLDASFGVVNSILRNIGFISENVAWLVDSNTAMISVIIPTIWKYYPFFTLVLLAQLQAIPPELYEASRMDGASILQQFRHVTWPAIRTASALAALITGIGIFREFDFIYPLTGGGPNDATQTLAVRIYNEAFQFFEMGNAAALGIVTMAICGLVIALANVVLGRERS